MEYVPNSCSSEQVMAEKSITMLNIVPAKKYLPDELMTMYRQRSGLTQGQLATSLGLKGYRSICNWESGTNLPAPDKLKRLIEYYLFQEIFSQGQEMAEASELWSAVKDKFDLTCAINRLYPPFDKSWFTSLLQLHQRPKAPEKPELPVKLVVETAPVKPNLPDQTSTLLGREREVEELSRWLKDPDIRLVTLLGPGGMGKTRLSLELAYNFVNYFRDGVRLIDLSILQDTGQVSGAIARALLVEGVSDETLVQNLKYYLRERELLLVLDNFEQVVEAAGFIGELLREAPSVKLIVTSREILGLELERAYELAPLALPDPTGALTAREAAKFGAIKLFVDRAARVKTGFQLNDENVAEVVKICRKLEGIPLALELTAGHLRFFSVAGLLDMLDRSLLAFNSVIKEKPARHRTMRATIEWSYALLKAEEQEFFKLLGLFNGGFTLQQVTAVYSRTAGRQIGELEVFEILAGLNAKSLVRTAPGGEDRFTLFETIREYALDRLKAAGELDRVAEIFAQYFLELCEREGTEKALKIGQGRKVMEREYRNILAGLVWAIEKGEVDLALQIGVALGHFWVINTYLSEGRAFLARILTLLVGERVCPYKGWVLFFSSELAILQGDLAQGEELACACLEIFRQLEHRPGIAYGLLNLGIITTQLGDYEPSLSYLEQALDLARELENDLAIARVLTQTGICYFYKVEYILSRKFQEEALLIVQKLGDKTGIISCLHNLANVTYRQGDNDQARRYDQEGLELIREGGNKSTTARLYNLRSLIEFSSRNYTVAAQYLKQGHRLNLELGNLAGIHQGYSIWADIYLALGEYRKSRQNREKSLEAGYRTGHRQGIAYGLNNLAMLEMKVGNLELAVTYQRQSLEIEAEIKDYYGIAYNLTGQAAVATKLFVKRDQPDLSLLSQAAVQLGVVVNLLETLPASLNPIFQDEFDAALNFTKENLPEADFTAAYTRGKTMTSEEAVAFSLQ